MGLGMGMGLLFGVDVVQHSVVSRQMPPISMVVLHLVRQGKAAYIARTRS